VVDTIGEWGRAEASIQDDISSAAVRARAPSGTDFARLRQVAIARDPELWALERRHVRAMADIITDAFARELGIPDDSLVARMAGETTAVALMEANARAARDDQAFGEALESVLVFIAGGLSAVGK